MNLQSSDVSRDNGPLVLSSSHWDIVGCCVNLCVLALHVCGLYNGLVNTTPCCVFWANEQSPLHDPTHDYLCQWSRMHVYAS